VTQSVSVTVPCKIAGVNDSYHFILSSVPCHTYEVHEIHSGSCFQWSECR